jgi:hypothetical protein
MLAAVVFMVLLGPRSDFAQAVETVRFQFKFVVTLALAGSALFLIVRMSRPGAGLAQPLGLLAVAPALLAGAVALELLALPAGLWRENWIGNNSTVCLTFIPLIGLLPLAVFVMALRYSAPTRPGLAGAVAGLLAGSVSATFYAAQCNDDSPFFVATWYPLAIAMLMAAGFVLGRLFARWEPQQGGQGIPGWNQRPASCIEPPSHWGHTSCCALQRHNMLDQDNDEMVAELVEKQANQPGPGLSGPGCAGRHREAARDLSAAGFCR